MDEDSDLIGPAKKKMMRVFFVEADVRLQKVVVQRFAGYGNHGTGGGYPNWTREDV